MTGNPYTSFDPTSLMQGWMKTATENWQETAKSWLESSQGKAATEFPGADILGRMFREPGAGGGLFPGENLAPQVGLKLAEIWQQGISSLQQVYMSQASGQSFGPDVFPFAGIDPGAFKAWTDLYEREASNQFRMPPMGITREHQERTNRVMEAFTRVQSAMTQFLYLTSLPMEKSLRGMREELSTIVKGELPAEEFKALYRKWVGILEEKYMALQKSREYIEVMNKAIDAFGAFKSARSQWMEDYLKMMAVPTQREMDDVYKDLYNLKKEVKELRKALEKR
ncbi:MAG: poly(R)-hydroxyalkanoic acid synthase subunit PhaE [Candidatus Deferrimicrobiaceae bacterium]